MTVLKKSSYLLAAGVALGASAFMAKPANATLGMEMHCQGTENCGMGGAGLAMAQGAISAAMNPALGAKMGNEATMSVGWFWADVKGNAQSNGDASGGGTIPNETGVQTSNADSFPSGSMAVNYRINDKTSMNLAIYPGGGGATEWENPRTASGTTDATDQQIDYMSLHISPSAAYKVTDKLSVGAGVIFSYSRLETDTFDNQFRRSFGGYDSYEYFKGIGGRVGLVYDALDNLTVAAAYRSTTYHETMDKYRNVFNGAINQPSSFGIGAKYTHTPSTIFAGDLKMVNWAEVDAIGRTPRAGAGDVCCGGFGWNSVPVIAFGVEHALNSALKVRAGYTWGESPIDDEHVFANFLFPAVTEHHLNAGASYAINDGFEIGASAYYAPKNSLTESGNGDFFSAVGNGTTLSAEQYGFQLSVTKSF